uniref:Uncharacterized protein n=1 Tax=Arundo donax TaxID=35708 RepID=A0A0A9PP98_ARUDO
MSTNSKTFEGCVWLKFFKYYCVRSTIVFPFFPL